MSIKRDFERLEAVAASLPDTTRARLVGVFKAVASTVGDVETLFTARQREMLQDAAMSIGQSLVLRLAAGSDVRKLLREQLAVSPVLQSMIGELLAAMPGS